MTEARYQTNDCQGLHGGFVCLSFIPHCTRIVPTQNVCRQGRDFAACFPRICESASIAACVECWKTTLMLCNASMESSKILLELKLTAIHHHGKVLTQRSLRSHALVKGRIPALAVQHALKSSDGLSQPSPETAAETHTHTHTLARFGYVRVCVCVFVRQKLSLSLPLSLSLSLSLPLSLYCKA